MAQKRALLCSRVLLLKFPDFHNDVKSMLPDFIIFIIKHADEDQLWVGIVSRIFKRLFDVLCALGFGMAMLAWLSP